jgi:hypothetical protein
LLITTYKQIGNLISDGSVICRTLPKIYDDVYEILEYDRGESIKFNIEKLKLKEIAKVINGMHSELLDLVDPNVLDNQLSPINRDSPTNQLSPSGYCKIVDQIEQIIRLPDYKFEF